MCLAYRSMLPHFAENSRERFPSCTLEPATWPCYNKENNNTIFCLWLKKHKFPHYIMSLPTQPEMSRRDIVHKGAGFDTFTV